jgi:hypothetical protein
MYFVRCGITTTKTHPAPPKHLIPLWNYVSQRLCLDRGRRRRHFWVKQSPAPAAHRR